MLLQHIMAERIIIKSTDYTTFEIPNQTERSFTIEGFRFDNECYISNIDKIILKLRDQQIAQYPMTLISALGEIIKTNKYYFVKFNNDILTREDRLYLSDAPVSISIKYVDDYKPNHEVVLVLTLLQIPPGTSKTIGRNFHNILHIQTVDIANDEKIELPLDVECAGFFIETYKLPSRIVLYLNEHEYMNLEKWQYKQLGQFIHKEKTDWNNRWNYEMSKYGLDTYTCDGIKKCLVDKPRLKIIWIPFAYDRTWNDKKWTTEPTGILMSRIDHIHFRATDNIDLKLHFLNKQYVCHIDDYHTQTNEFIILH